MQSPHPQLVEKLDYQIQRAPCAITGEFDKVIVTKLNTLKIDYVGEDGQSHEEAVDVHGQYSERGLEMMLSALRDGELPLPIAVDPEGIRTNCTYHWTAVYPNGDYISQFEADGREHHLGHVDLDRILELWVRPRDFGRTGLPSYCLHREYGFDRVEIGEPTQRLDLPMPLAPFHFEYRRRVAITFGMGPGQESALPPHVKHCLGWRVDTLHGDAEETWFEIAIEDDDGSWQVERATPEGSRHLSPRRIEAATRIIDPLGARDE